eukprot:3610970-Ditylum_brightwellii.AAC.1
MMRLMMKMMRLAAKTMRLMTKAMRLTLRTNTMLALVTGVAPVENRLSCWWPVAWRKGQTINACVSRA